MTKCLCDEVTGGERRRHSDVASGCYDLLTMYQKEDRLLPAAADCGELELRIRGDRCTFHLQHILTKAGHISNAPWPRGARGYRIGWC